MKIFKSIRFKLTFISLLAVFFITTLIVYSDVRDTETRLINTQKEKAVLMSDIIKQSIMLLMLENKWKEAQILIEDLTKSNPELEEVRIFHPLTGRIIVSADKKDIGKQIYSEDWNNFVNKKNEPFVIKKKDTIFATRVSTIDNKPACYRCHPQEQKVLGVLDVEVSLLVAQKSILEATYRHFTGLIIGFVVITIIFLISGELLISRPLMRLTGVMKTVESGDLSVRAKHFSQDELGYLALAFNNMIDALESAQTTVAYCHKQQMEHAAKLASLGQIVSGIAHEIKNPLAGISCAVQVFQSEMAENDPQREIVTEVINQINRLDKIVKDLLSYAKPKAPHYLPVKIAEVVDRALFFIYPEARKQDVVIDLQIQEDIPDIIIDPDQMQQVFLNLIVNSLQAMPAGGKLTISATQEEYAKTKDMTHDLAACDKLFVISVQDTGNGIAPEDLDNIFQPFFTKKTRGTGLGLSISRRIVQEHGGEITVSSELGRGSRFVVYLPVKNL